MSERRAADRADPGHRQGLPPGLGLRSRRVLHGISFSVREGEIFGFVGPNGAGKTTTLKILMGLIRPSAGAASILGHDVSETGFRRHVGFLPENPYFYDFLTGREILALLRPALGRAARRLRARVDTLLDVGGARVRRRRAPAHLLEGHAAAHRHRTGAGARSERGLPRRADERPRPDRTQGGPRPDPAAPLGGQDRLHEHAHPLRRGDGLRPRRDHRAGTDPVRGRDARVPGRRRAARPTSCWRASRRRSRLRSKSSSRRGCAGWTTGSSSASRRSSVNPLLHAAIAAGAEVVSVTPHRMSLESIFLSAVAADRARAKGAGGEERT